MALVLELLLVILKLLHWREHHAERVFKAALWDLRGLSLGRAVLTNKTLPWLL